MLGGQLNTTPYDVCTVILKYVYSLVIGTQMHLAPLHEAGWIKTNTIIYGNLVTILRVCQIHRRITGRIP